MWSRVKRLLFSAQVGAILRAVIIYIYQFKYPVYFNILFGCAVVDMADCLSPGLVSHDCQSNVLRELHEQHIIRIELVQQRQFWK